MSIDAERTRPAAFDAKDGYSGQDYDRRDESIQGGKMPSGTVGVTDTMDTPADAPAEPGISDEPGHRAHFDPRTGEVHGSGAGTGGGNPGENFDPDED